MTVFTDEGRLKQILLNLISNSFKFTVSGFIKIKAKYNILNHSIEIFVEDTGLGIKSEDHHLIFQDYVQLNLEKEYNRNGSGLGLSITKSLANSLNHEIGFSSKFGEGSKFYLRIKCSNKIQKKTLRCSSKTVKNQMNNDVLSNISHEDHPMITENRNKIIEEEFPSFINFESNNQKSKLTPVNNMTFSVDEDIKLININTFRINELEITNNELEIITDSFTIRSNNYIDDDKFTIVVLDDIELVRKTTVNMIIKVLSILKLTDFRIIEGRDGIDLLNFVRSDKNYRIKYIFTDENMMYLNGSEVVQLIRKFEQDMKIKNYKIISVTAFDDEETRKNILKSGLDKIISKPCSKYEIMNILKSE